MSGEAVSPVGITHLGGVGDSSLGTLGSHSSAATGNFTVYHKAAMKQVICVLALDIILKSGADSRLSSVVRLVVLRIECETPMLAG